MGGVEGKGKEKGGRGRRREEEEEKCWDEMVAARLRTTAFSGGGSRGRCC